MVPFLLGGNMRYPRHSRHRRYVRHERHGSDATPKAKIKTVGKVQYSVFS